MRVIRHLLILTAGGLAVLPLAACEQVSGSSPAADVVQAPLYYGASVLWSDPSISVCWESTPGGTQTQRTWVRTAVEAAFESTSGVNFTGWGGCGGGAAEVVIRVGDSEWPQALIGERSAATSPNVWMNFFTNAQQQLAGFEYCYSYATPSIGITGRTWSSRQRQCIETIAVHEFAHVLAIAHEQNRTDTPVSCNQPNDGLGDTPYGYWDLTSISNYCNPAWNADGILSPLDIDGLQAFYGEHASGDLLWYGIGDVWSYGGASVNQLNFEPFAQNVSNPYTPFAGDFDGDGYSDIFWYRPGSGADSIWYGSGVRNSFTSVSTSVSGSYKPVVADFDGDGYSDVFWYGPGASSDSIWFGSSTRGTFSAVSTSVSGTYTPLAGDFDGDGYGDVLWYGPGSSSDAVWYGSSTRGSFQSHSVTQGGTHVPVTGDFDNDGFSDVLWYGPGSTSDFFWFGSSTRGAFSSVSTSVSGTYKIVAADFDGNGTADILWNGSGNDPVWLMDSFSRGSYVSTNTRVSSNTAVPIVGDYDGDGLSDIFIYED